MKKARDKGQPPLYKVRGREVYGRAVPGEGGRVTLNAAPPNWPFPRFETFERAQLVRLDGADTEQMQPT